MQTLPFHFVDGFLAVQKLLSLISSFLLIFASVACAVGVIAQISLPRPMSRNFSLCFLLGVLGFLLFRLSLTHFELMFWGGVERDPSSFFRKPLVGEAPLPLTVLTALVKHQRTTCRWFISGLSILLFRQRLPFWLLQLCKMA